MDAGFIFKFGRMVPGREDKALELFGEALAFWRGHLEKGAVSYVEPFLFSSGDREVDLGFFLVKGTEGKLHPIVNGEEFRMLVTRAEYVVEHLQIEWLLAGDEVEMQVARSAKVAPEFVPA